MEVNSQRRETVPKIIIEAIAAYRIDPTFIVAIHPENKASNMIVCVNSM
jgi:hypothetical protein